MNIIHSLFQLFCEWIGAWPPARLGFFLQAVMLFGFPFVFCYALFHHGNRSVLLQVIALMMGVVLSVAIPIEGFLPHSAMVKACLFLFCLVFLCFLPAAVPKLLTPTLGLQRKLSIALYILLLVLFLANLLVKQ